jgi:hypothetical protein
MYDVREGLRGPPQATNLNRLYAQQQPFIQNGGIGHVPAATEDSGTDAEFRY